MSAVPQTDPGLVQSYASGMGRLEPRTWRNSAACRDTDPDLFFPVGQTGPAIDHIASARAVCMTCSVRNECLEYALMTNQDAGIWGGLTEDERRKIRRERRKQRAAAKR